jgi:hypothetical protein
MMSPAIATWKPAGMLVWVASKLACAEGAQTANNAITFRNRLFIVNPRAESCQPNCHSGNKLPMGEFIPTTVSAQNVAQIVAVVDSFAFHFESTH